MALAVLERGGEPQVLGAGHKARSLPGGRPVNMAVEHLAGAALRLATDPMLDDGERLRDLVIASGHDPQLLGRAWLHVSIEAMRHPGRVAVATEKLLRSALDLATIV